MRAPLIYPVAQWVLILGLLSVTVAAPGVYSVVAAVLLSLHMVALLKTPAPSARLVLSVGTAAVLPLCAEAAGGGFAAVLGVLPALPGIESALRGLASPVDLSAAQRRDATFSDGRQHANLPFFPGRTSTPVLRTLVLTSVATAGLGVAAGRWVLAATGGVLLVWLLAMVGFVFLRLPPRFVEPDRVRLRALAGKRSEVTASLRPITQLPCVLYLQSPVLWVEVQPRAAVLNGRAIPLRLRLTPPLAGPSRLALEALAVDPWALTGTRQGVDVADLRIIPRARYAAWLARRYLERTQTGTTTAMISGAAKRLGPRGGVEYHGARAYSPGDSLRDIDWKHTAKLRSTIVKEFRAAGSEAGVLVVRLEAPDADSADRLASRLVMTALTLAQEGIPVVLAGYTQEDVVDVTPLLASRETVRQVLKFTDQIARAAPVHRTLEPPKIGRLRRMHRLLGETGTAHRLLEFIALEIQAVTGEASSHPAARALKQAAARLRPPAAVMTLSVPPDQTAALDVALEQLRARGYHALSLWN